MKTLAIDTATQNCSCCLLENDTILASESNQERFSHNKVLFKQIQAVAKKGNTKIADLDNLVISLGPGSFTGLRVGLSSIKGLAYALNIPVYGVSTPDVLSLHILKWLTENKVNEKYSVRIFLDGKQKDFFTALYHIQFKNNILNFEKVSDLELKSLKDIENIKPALFNYTDLDKLKFKPFTDKYPSAEVETEVLPQAENAGLLYHFGYSNKVDIATFEPEYYKDFIVHQPKKKNLER